jgi:thioredoxin reductase (NADPH)
MSEVYDIIVVGGGPAGLAAGIYGSRSRLKTAILTKGKPGGQAATTQELENYPGFSRGTTGPALMESMAQHASSFGTEILREEAVELDLGGEIKLIRTRSKKEYRSRTVILAPGAEPRSLNIKGEHSLKGKGVSFCATCDADFFEDLDVVVVGNGDAAIEEAMYLTKFAETVTIIVIHDEGVLDCNKASAERAFDNPKIKWVWNSVLDEIKGDGLVESVMVKNIKTGELAEMATNGVFFFVGSVPKTDLLKGKVELDEQGYIVTNDLMETSVAGVYAAGDVRAKYLRQVITAASDGAIAAVAIEKYLVEEDSFRERVLEAPSLVMVAFWSPQNGASIEVISMLEQLASQYKDLRLVKMDTYRNQRVAGRYGIKEIPNVLFFKNGAEMARITGQCSRADVVDLINLFI